MAFITGLILLDAPASALNNAGADETARTENAVATKLIRTRQGAFPYVSAQAFRYWLRTTLQKRAINGWRAAPVWRERKVAYTDANPLEWWDDDLFGYFRASSKRADAVKQRQADTTRATETPTVAEITRVSPFRVSTLVSIAPVNLVQDFGTMSRLDGDPVPHEHQFYRTVLKGLFSLDLHAVGTFSYRQRTGFRNLDEERKRRAEEAGLQHLKTEQSYRLSEEQRATRVSALLRGMALLSGGAKQTIHYTDTTPAVVIAMVMRGGNNPLQYVITANSYGLPQVDEAALAETLRVWGDQVISELYVGWTQGFYSEERARFQAILGKILKEPNEGLPGLGISFGHPRETLEQMAEAVLRNSATWLE